MINDSKKCVSEADDIVDICPNWALDAMKEKTRFSAKVNAINTHKFNAAMATSPYNEGRTIANVSNKNWVHGTRHYLRPDTMWADDRYAKITQAEINEAKKRL